MKGVGELFKEDTTSKDLNLRTISLIIHQEEASRKNSKRGKRGKKKKNKVKKRNKSTHKKNTEYNPNDYTFDSARDCALCTYFYKGRCTKYNESIYDTAFYATTCDSYIEHMG